jgi:DNA-binding transcriptional MerR regulator
MESTWTITELAELAGTALADEPVRVNGRVRETPNARLIRWYTTIGLVDPPLGRRGRIALYGPRHLLQLVAIKRRQAAGRAIAEIQAELTGATDAALRDIARLPEPLAVAAATGAAVRRPESRDRFWAEPPAEPPRPTESAEPPSGPGPSAPAVVPGIRLAAGVTLLLDPLDGDPRPIAADDLAAIAAAARPLLDELRRRGLADDPAETDDRR